jgi:hypothetical protein
MDASNSPASTATRPAEDVHQDQVDQLHRAGREVGLMLGHGPVDAALAGGVVAGPDQGQQAVPAGADGFMLPAGEPARRGDDEPAAASRKVKPSRCSCS